MKKKILAVMLACVMLFPTSVQATGTTQDELSQVVTETSETFPDLDTEECSEDESSQEVVSEIVTTEELSPTDDVEKSDETTQNTQIDTSEGLKNDTVKEKNTKPADLFVEEGKDDVDLEMAAKKMEISYKTHIQSFGWLEPSVNGEINGSTGLGKRLEAFSIKLKHPKYKGGIQYRAHVQSYGWQNWMADGAVAGTIGQSKRVEAIQIKLTGKMAQKYDVYYRVYGEHYGWLGWTKNGRTSGTMGCGYRLEAIQMKLVKKGGKAPGNTKNASYNKSKNISYRSNVEGLGWQDYVYAGAVSGTMGRQKRLEAIKLNVDTSEYSGGIKYRSHVQSIGWQNWVKNGAVSGTVGQGKRLEAIEIKLTGELNRRCDIYYRTHCQSHGWMNWKKNGQTSGTIGESKRIEAIQVIVVPKGTDVEFPEAEMPVSGTIDPTKPMIALTYDDGPYSPVTNRILNALESVGGKATFFVVGNRISANLSSVVRADKIGCQIANHTWDHKGVLTGMSSASIATEISQCNTAIQNAIGKAPTVVRPVGGGVNANVLATINYPMIIWSVDTMDWKNRNANSVYNAVMSNVKDGDIILMHDLYPSTAEASERFIPELAKKGYQFVTVDELAYYKGVTMQGHHTYNAFR